MGIDTRREISHIWRQYNKYGETFGEDVVWFKFDTSEESRWNDIYDEGGLNYLPGIRLAVLWIDQIEDTEQYSGEGRRPTQRLRFAIGSKSLRERGIATNEAHGAGPVRTVPAPPNPYQTGRSATAWVDDRLNDVVFYDSRFYAISNFQIRGRTPEGDVIIGVSALEMQVDDYSLDKFPMNTAYGA